jgi:hypothetical protein
VKPGEYSAQRPRRRHHLCLLLQEISFLIFRSVYAHKYEHLCTSHCIDSLIVASELHPYTSWYHVSIDLIYLGFLYQKNKLMHPCSYMDPM